MDSTKSRVNWRQAAGEALLIFLGVGFALVGQAWWEYREDRQIEEHLLSGIRADLSRDTVDMTRVIRAARERMMGANRLLQLIQDPAAWGSPSSRTPLFVEAFAAEYDTASISPPRALQMVSGVRQIQTLDISNAGYTEAMASGQLDVIRNLQLRSQILDYYSTVGRVSQNMDARTEAQWHRLGEALANVGLSPVGAGSEERLLLLLLGSPAVISELKNVREWAVIQGGRAPELVAMAEDLIGRLSNASGP